MFEWVLNTPLFRTIFSFRKRSERKDNSLPTYYSNKLKKSSENKNSPGLDDSRASRNNSVAVTHFFETNLISLLQTTFDSENVSN